MTANNIGATYAMYNLVTFSNGSMIDAVSGPEDMDAGGALYQAVDEEISGGVSRAVSDALYQAIFKVTFFEAAHIPVGRKPYKKRKPSKKKAR